MAKERNPRILRSYRHMPPGRFRPFNQKVRTHLADNQKIPETTWAANPSLLPSYFAASEKHDRLFHESTFGSILVIAEREVLEKQIINYLDEIASLLEAAAVRNPDILLSSGFDLAKERRGSTRTKLVSAASEASTAEVPATKA